MDNRDYLCSACADAYRDHHSDTDGNHFCGLCADAEITVVLVMMPCCPWRSTCL